MMKGNGRLTVLDFSGTLSMGAVRFARPQSLERALQHCGLADWGVDVQNFWTEIINPTWQEGSTTAVGYCRLLYDRALRIATARGFTPQPDRLYDAAERFTAEYLRCSAIEPEWFPVLRQLAAGRVTVIATDHYAEATAHIIEQMAALGVPAAPALQAKPGQLLVANSADLGHHKAEAAFWRALRSAAGLTAVYAVAVVDDFGYNEQPEDSYASTEKVAARRAATVAAIAAAWNVPVDVFPFLLHRENDYPTLVAAAGRFLIQEP